MLKSLFIAFLAFIFISNENAVAQPTHNLIQMPRSMGMGGVGVGLADDEYALFNNVAGLAGSDLKQLKMLGLSGEGSWGIYTALDDSLNAMKHFGISSLSALMGKDIYMRGGATPILSLKNFSLAYVVDGQFSLNQYNSINPIFNLGAMLTQGVQVGYGYSLNKGKRATNDLRIGAATKVLWRKGGYYQLNSADLLAATATSDSNAYLNSVMGPYSIGVGFDAGTQYVMRVDNRSEISAGVSVTDIGDTKFKDTRGMAIPMDVAFGLGYKTNAKPFRLAGGLDYRNILTATSFTNKVHLGLEVGVPFFDFYLGLNQLYITYGLAFDLWIMKISLVSYGEEQGISFHQNPSRRYLFQFDFKLPI